MKYVCVIGAGVSGIIAARYLKEHYSVTIYEANPTIGGIWVYNKDQPGDNHTPMYKYLLTNIPKQMMCYKDLAYDDDQKCFLTSEQVMDYMERYCEKFSIKSLIEFNTPVTSVKPEISDETVKWVISTAKGKHINTVKLVLRAWQPQAAFKLNTKI